MVTKMSEGEVVTENFQGRAERVAGTGPRAPISEVRPAGHLQSSCVKTPGCGNPPSRAVISDFPSQLSPAPGQLPFLSKVFLFSLCGQVFEAKILPIFPV